MPSTVKITTALTNKYVALYTKKYGVKPHVNSYKARFAFDTMLNHLERGEVEGLLEYYFNTVSTNGHSLDWFLYNYESLAISMETQKEDAERLEIIRKETERRTEEWRKRIEHRDTGS